MYFLFRFHNMKPSEYKQMGIGEQKIIHQFMKQEIDDINKENSGGK